MIFTKSFKKRSLLLLWLAVLCWSVFKKFEIVSWHGDMSSADPTFRSSNTDTRDAAFNGTLRNEVEYFERLLKLSGSCRKQLSLGGYSCKKWMDGDKRVCLDKHVMPPRNNCLVYSFGVGDDITFEGSLSQFLNCEIHMYDPLEDASWLQGSLTENMHFHRVGISSVFREIPPRGNISKQLALTFDKMLEENGHLGRTIHYLKMDVESSEWEVLEHMLDNNLLDNVLQLAMEIHTKHIELLPYSQWLPTLQKQNDILEKLEDIGFRKVSYIINVNALGAIQLPYEEGPRPACGEIFYIRDPVTMKSW
ncbi:uncharacterized protein [Macrobrachium rosenbergii]|uniref:uncharacterized protein n=1 Tax=Macrobrachium rosenbergii TaxID=79674 RepID=UPI0034D7100F